MTTLKSPHKDWRLDVVNPIDIRAVGLEQLLTQLWLRVLYDNRPVTRQTRGFKTIAELANQLDALPDLFQGFGGGLAESWLRADLVKTLKRQPDYFSVARPLHALALRVRNTAEANDSGASAIVYGWLVHCGAPLLDQLKSLLQVDASEPDMDLASLALALLGSEQTEDVPMPKPAEAPIPLCQGQAYTYVDDLRRLLAYQSVIPRPALVEHIRRITGLHVGLHLLRMFRIATASEAAHGSAHGCTTCQRKSPEMKDCPFRLELVVDCGEDPRSDVARLAEESWLVQEDHLARYVRSHLALKKLDQFADYLDLERPASRLPHSTIDEIAAIEVLAKEDLLDLYFSQQIDLLKRDSAASSTAQSDHGFGARIDELRRQYADMGLSSFRIYVTILADFAEKRWVRYHRFLVDSLFGKNLSDGLLRQPLGGKRRRRAALTPGLLETLALAAVVVEGRGTRPLRVDVLVDKFADRYDLLISRPPVSRALDTEVARVLAQNTSRFKARLRETGLYVDLSDAFLAQTVKPRHNLDPR